MWFWHGVVYESVRKWPVLGEIFIFSYVSHWGERVVDCVMMDYEPEAAYEKRANMYDNFAITERL